MFSIWRLPSSFFEYFKNGQPLQIDKWLIVTNKQTNVFNQDGQALHDRILALAPALSSASAHMVGVTLIITKLFDLDWIVNKVSSNHLDNDKS